jgi:hypothetical protein
MDFSNLQISFGVTSGKKVGYGVQDTEAYPNTPVVTISVSKNEKRNVSSFSLNRKAQKICGFAGKNFVSSENSKYELVMEAIGKDDAGETKAIFIVNVTGNETLSNKAKRFSKGGSFSSATLLEKVTEHFNVDPDNQHEIECEDATFLIGMPAIMLKNVLVTESTSEILETEENESYISEHETEDVYEIAE